MLHWRERQLRILRERVLRDRREGELCKRIKAARQTAGSVGDSVVIGVGSRIADKATFVISGRDVLAFSAVLSCLRYLPGHKTWGLPSDFDPLTADADEVAAVCCDLARKDNAYDDDDLLTLLFNVGIEVCEPTYPDSFSSLVHCYVQWFVRDKWILDPLDEEQQQRIVDHVVFKLLYEAVDEDDGSGRYFREKKI